MKDDLVIYSFTYPHFVKNGLTEGYIETKIGDSTQGLDDGLTIDESGKLRISQQGGSAEAYKKIIVGTFGVNKKLISRDFVLHEELKKRGLRPRALDGQGKEYFRIPVTTVKECYHYLSDLVESFGVSSKKKLKLRKEQDRTLKEAVEIYNSTDSDRVDIASNLPPRFGKTCGHALSFFNKLDKKVLILPSSWLSTHTSFQEDINQFRDFNDIVFIKTDKPEYKKQIKEVLSQNKRVALAVSLFTKDKKQFNTIRNIPNGDKFVCIDEGDFGSWTSKKREIIEYLIPENKSGKGPVVTMSGTNIARMVTGSKKIDGVVQSTYMALEKTEKNIVKRSAVKLQLSNTDKYVRELTEDDYFSYNKAMSDPMKSKNFWSLFVKGLTGNTENPAYKNLNLSSIMEDVFNCGMMFVSGTNKNINSLKSIIETSIPNWSIIVVNGDHTSNNKVQGDVRREIEFAKQDKKEGILIISNTMGSRSFSISEIQATIIAYDKGGIDPTVQKISRGFTPGKMLNGKTKKTGYIVTCSMDSNRDDTMIKIFTEEAAVQSNISKESMNKTIKQLLNNVSILSTDYLGNTVEMTPDELIEEMSSSQVLSKVAFALSKPQNIFDNKDMLDSFLSMKLSKSGKNKKDNQQLPTAKNFISSGNKKLSQKQKENILNQVMKKIEMLCDTASMVAALSKGNTYRECLNNIDSEKFERRFGIDKQYVIEALDNDILPEKLLNPIVVNTMNTIKSGDINKFQDLSTIGIFPELGIVKSTEKELWLRELKKIKNLKKLKIASVGTNMGHEVSALLELGVPKENITVIDKNGFPKLWKNAGINVIEKLIEEVNNMKFDLVVGNPPYQNVHGVNSHALWESFVSHAHNLVNDNGYVAMITPLIGKRKIKSKFFENDFLVYKTDDVAKHFSGVGSTFCFHIVRKGKTTNLTNINGEMYDLSNFDFIPNKMDKDIGKLIKRLTTGTPLNIKSVGVHSSKKHLFSDKQSKSFPYEYQHTSSQIKYSSKKCDVMNYKLKIICSKSGYLNPWLDTNGIGITENSWCIPVSSKNEGKKIIDFLNSDDVKTFVSLSSSTTSAHDPNQYKSLCI